MHERLGLRGVALWTLAFCAHRVAVLWWGFNGLFYWEEAYRLLMAEALWQRWPWPLLDLQADPYAGGSLVFSILAVPLVATFGPSIVGLKLMALLWSALGLVAWTVLVDRYWGRRAAHLFAFLFVFAPPLFVVYNLIAMGSHAEVVTLAGVQLLLAYRCLYGPERAPGAFVAWAAVAGLGTWFTYVSILPFAACVAVGLLGGALPPRRWPALIAGFLLGFAPWVLANVGSGGRGLEVVARTFHAGSAARSTEAGAMLVYLLSKGIPLGLRYPRLPLANLYLLLYVAGWAALLVAALGAARRAAGVGSRVRTLVRSAPELPLLVLVPAFVLMLAASDQVFLVHELVPFLSFRLLVPFLPAVMLTLAVATTRLPRRWAWPVIGILGVLGFAGTASVLMRGASERPRLAAHVRTIGAEAAGHLLFYKHGADLPLLTERIAAMPEELHGPAWQGIGFSIAFHDAEDRPVAEFVDVMRRVPPAAQNDVVRGVRLALGPGIEQVKARPASPHTEALLAAVDALPSRPVTPVRP